MVPLRCLVRLHFGHLWDFSDSFLTAFSEVDSGGGPLATPVLVTTSALSTMRAAMRAGSPVGSASAANADQYPGYHREDAGELEDGGKSGVRDEYVEEARHDL